MYSDVPDKRVGEIYVVLTLCKTKLYYLWSREGNGAVFCFVQLDLINIWSLEKMDKHRKIVSNTLADDTH